jgi:hypothetical protein
MTTLPTTTPAESEGRTLTIGRTDAHGTLHHITGIVSLSDGFGYLTVGKGTYREYAITLGGYHTPIPYVR